jgi:hypothetical protein
LGALVADDFSPHQADETRNSRRIQSRHAGTIEHVPLPADPDQREALLEKQRIRQVLGRVRVGLAAEIEHPKHRPAPAVGHLEERRAVAFGRIDRLQHVEVGAELHQTLSVAWGKVDVHNNAIGGALGVDGEVNFPHDSLVSGVTGQRATLGDVHASNRRAGGGGK